MAALLKGLLFGPDDAAFSPTHTRKGGRLYRYYVSQTVLKHGAGSCPVGRVPANEIESTVIDQLRGVFRQPEIVAGTWRAAGKQDDSVSESEAREALIALDPLWDELFPAEQARIVALLVERVDIGTDGLNVRLRVDDVDGQHFAREAGEAVRETGRGASPCRGFAPRGSCCRAVVKRGGRKEMLLPQVAPNQRARLDGALVKALARAFRWQRMLESGEFATLSELAASENIAKSYLCRVLRLTLLAPGLVEAILDGRRPETLTLPALMKPVPSAWEGQRAIWHAAGD